MRMLKRQGKKRDKPRQTAYEKALGLLARREQSRRELRDRLQRDGYAREDIEATLDRLAEDNYQSDERFSEMLVRNRIAQGYGPRRLQAELRTHGFGDAKIRDLLEQAEADWPASAHAQLQRRYGHEPAPEYAERARRAQFLLRRGFDAATVNAVTRAEADAATDSED